MSRTAKGLYLQKSKGLSVKELETDLRHVMQPHTAMKLEARAASPLVGEIGARPVAAWIVCEGANAVSFTSDSILITHLRVRVPLMLHCKGGTADYKTVQL